MADDVTLGARVDAALRALPGGYRALLQRALAVWRADARVRAVWLSGSLATQSADRASDLDLIVTVGERDRAAFALDWPVWRSAIADSVVARPVGRGTVWTMVTPEWLRWDVVLEAAEDLASPLAAARLAVLDRDGLEARLPPLAPPRGPSAERAEELVVEWFRVTAMPETITLRQDWLLATVHVEYLRSLVYQLFLEANRPIPPQGVKRWSGPLAPAQREALRALPVAADSDASLVGAHLAISRVFLPAAEALLRRLGRAWPTALERAAARHLRLMWDVDEPYPRP